MQFTSQHFIRMLATFIIAESLDTHNISNMLKYFLQLSITSAHFSIVGYNQNWEHPLRTSPGEGGGSYHNGDILGHMGVKVNKDIPKTSLIKKFFCHPHRIILFSKCVGFC